MVTVHDLLAQKIANLKHRRQSTSQEDNGSQIEIGNVKMDRPGIELVQETTGQNCNDYDERIKAIETELREMKKMEKYQRSKQCD